MGQFMGHQPRVVLRFATAKPDVAAVGEGASVNVSRGGVGGVVLVHAHATQIKTGASLHALAEHRFNRCSVASPRQSGSHAVRRAPLLGLR